MKVDKNDSLDFLVTALCRDFERRREIIERTGASRRTLVEFRYLNFKIMDAVTDIVEEKDALLYIREIGGNIGYAKSCTEGISEVSYKKLKKCIKENIAKKLHLCD